jgi:hypothetical protein
VIFSEWRTSFAIDTARVAELQARPTSAVHIEPIVRSAREFAGRHSAEVAKQATRAAAVLRTQGVDELRQLLDLDLPKWMNRADEWGTFRRAARQHIETVLDRAGVPGLLLWLGWVQRIGKTPTRAVTAAPKKPGPANRGASQHRGPRR